MKNIVYITIDCLRKDALPLYNPTLDLDLFINNFFRESFIFNNCITAASATGPSLSSIMLSQFPFHHGYRLNGTIYDFETPTLAEKLSQQGLTCGGVVSVDHLGTYFQFGKGFHRYYDFRRIDKLYKQSTIIRKLYNLYLFRWQRFFLPREKDDPNVRFSCPAKKITKNGLRFLKDVKDKPFFLWVHYFDLHRIQKSNPNYIHNYEDLRKGQLTKYLNALKEADSEIEKLINYIKEKGKLEDTIFILSADHGEAIFDREDKNIFQFYTGHGRSVYEEEINIPLLIRYPGFRQQRVVDRLIRTIDIYPTLVELMDSAIDHPIDGESFANIFRNQEWDREDFAYAEGYSEHSDIACLRTSEWKLIRNGRWKDELYHIIEDRGEKRNLVDTETTVYRRMMDQLSDLLHDQKKHERESDEKVTQMLKDLGYM